MSTKTNIETKVIDAPTVRPRPISKYIRCCDREIHYVEWGRPNAPALMMHHGLARTCRDFDELAAALSDTYRIICPDVIGRGWSQWSEQPEQDYRIDFYARIMASLADQLSIDRTRWIGTSMGGILGIWTASTYLKDRISHLIINDVSPAVVPQEAVERIVAYVSNPPQFDTVTEFEGYLRMAYKPFGQQTDAFWRWMAESSARRLPNGKITNHYHPLIMKQVETDPHLGRIWEAYDSLSMPTLVLRGAASDVLAKSDAIEMTKRGPRARLAEIAGCGHAPTLNTVEQIDLIRKFLA